MTHLHEFDSTVDQAEVVDASEGCGHEESWFGVSATNHIGRHLREKERWLNDDIEESPTEDDYGKLPAPTSWWSATPSKGSKACLESNRPAEYAKLVSMYRDLIARMKSFHLHGEHLIGGYPRTVFHMLMDPHSDAVVAKYVHDHKLGEAVNAVQTLAAYMLPIGSEVKFTVEADGETDDEWLIATVGIKAKRDEILGLFSKLKKQWIKKVSPESQERMRLTFTTG